MCLWKRAWVTALTQPYARLPRHTAPLRRVSAILERKDFYSRIKHHFLSTRHLETSRINSHEHDSLLFSWADNFSLFHRGATQGFQSQSDPRWTSALFVQLFVVLSFVQSQYKKKKKQKLRFLISTTHLLLKFKLCLISLPDLWVFIGSSIPHRTRMSWSKGHYFHHHKNI